MDVTNNRPASDFNSFVERVGDITPRASIIPQETAPAERISINFADKLVTIDDASARFVAPSGDDAFPNLIAYRADEADLRETFVPVNGFGDSHDCNGFIINYVEPVVEHTTAEIEEDDELELVIDETRVSSGVITLPATLRLRVRHNKRGPGTVLKVREGDHARSLYIRSDRSDEHKGHSDCYWALNRQLRDIASY